MPLKKGTSQNVISQNIAEFHGGETYKKTKAKYGKEVADKQAVAAAISLAQRSARNKKRGK
jgi:hypothetical protein